MIALTMKNRAEMEESFLEKKTKDVKDLKKGEGSETMKRAVSVYLSVPEYKQLEEYAIATQTSISDAARTLIKDGLKPHD